MKSQPGRSRRAARGRLASWTALGAVGSVAALTVLFGDLLARGLGLVVLLAGTVLACLLAWRENRMAERLRQAHALGEAMEYAERLRSERARHRAFVKALGGRLGAMRQHADDASRRACTLQQELSTLRGNYEALRVELEMQAALESDAQVIELARPGGPVDPWETARELWNRGDQAAVKRLA